jgi:catechol 2,3-dioxygenase-like lactoylglutathione lyase family enzyme
MNMKLEVVLLPVADVDLAKAFYEKMGFRLDADYAADEKFRVLQFTPPLSDASIISARESRRPAPARRSWSWL